MTYLKRNRLRAISIIVMLACTGVVFMGGMYVDNINDMYTYPYRNPSQYAIWYPQGINNDIKEEANRLYEEQTSFYPESAANYIPIDVVSGNVKSIMGFNNGSVIPLMTSKDDFEKFVKYTDILPKDIVLEDGEVVISELLANNWGVKEGDILKANGEKEQVYLSADMRIKRILPLDGMQMYGWSSEIRKYGVMVLSTTEDHEATLCEDLNQMAEEITDKYPHINVYTNEILRKESKDQTEMLVYMFYAVLVIVSLVFAITINATFTAMFEKRKYEFSVYKALGISKGKIFGKILGELLTMDGIALAAAAIVCFLTIKGLNSILYARGMQFIKISTTGVIGTILCNLAIIVPVMFFNMKRLKKYDITVY